MSRQRKQVVARSAIDTVSYLPPAALYDIWNGSMVNGHRARHLEARHFPLFSFSFLRTETRHALTSSTKLGPGSLPSDSRELKQDSPHNNDSTRYQNELV